MYKNENLKRDKIQMSEDKQNEYNERMNRKKEHKKNLTKRAKKCCENKQIIRTNNKVDEKNEMNKKMKLMKIIKREKWKYEMK